MYDDNRNTAVISRLNDKSVVGRRTIEPRPNFSRDLELMPGAREAGSQADRATSDHTSHLRRTINDGVDEQVRLPVGGRRTSNVDAERRFEDLVLAEVGRQPELTGSGMIHRRICFPSTIT